MMQKKHLPIFPLNILPLNEEVIPLHIFEQRYRQLLDDMVKNDMAFGILYVSPDNQDRIGTIVNLVSVIKKYDTGESDIIVKGENSFMMTKYYRTYKDKRYAGGEVLVFDELNDVIIDKVLLDKYLSYRRLLNPDFNHISASIHDVANMLELDNADRVKYLRLLTKEKKETFLLERLKYRTYIVEQELRYKHNFSLN